MAYGTRFILSFSNELNELIDIYFDYKDYVGGIQNLTGDDDCLNIKNTTGDEDKSAPILGTECYVKIWVKPEDGISIADFVVEQDDDIRVTVIFNSNTDLPVFTGFIIAEDNSEPMLDPPYTIQIRALDCIGLLKGVYLYDTNGNPFTGKMSIIGWLTQMLNATGQQLPLRTYFNISHPSMLTGINPLEQIFIDVATFGNNSATAFGDTNPADFNTGYDDYLTALTKIVTSLRCKLFQENGFWHLVNMWEYLNPSGYSYYEYTFGDPVNGIIPFSVTNTAKNVDYTVSVGKKEIIQLVEEDGINYLKMATKSFEFTYSYDQSLNKINNQNLSQGARDASHDEQISSFVIDPTLNNGHEILLNTQGFQAGGFAANNGTGDPNSINNGPYPLLPATAPSFIREVFDPLGYTILRNLVMKDPGPGINSILRCTKILIDVGDIFQLSVTWRTRTAQTPNTGAPIGYALLTGDDGTFWAMRSIANNITPGNPTKWIQCNSNFRQLVGNPFTPPMSTAPVLSTANWNNCGFNTDIMSGESYATAPISGAIEIIFTCQAAPSGPGITEAWFKDITVTILPYLQGAFQQLKGDYNFSQTNKAILQTEAEDVAISDSPKRYFKGALMTSVTGLQLYTTQFFRIGYIESYRFTQLMQYIYYSHFFRQLYKIEGTLKGMSYLNPADMSRVFPIGLLHTYVFIDTRNPTKRFMCTSYEKNWNTGEWRGVFVETSKDVNDIGLAIPDLFTFAYLFNTQ